MKNYIFLFSLITISSLSCNPSQASTPQATLLPNKTITTREELLEQIGQAEDIANQLKAQFFEDLRDRANNGNLQCNKKLHNSIGTEIEKLALELAQAEQYMHLQLRNYMAAKNNELVQTSADEYPYVVNCFCIQLIARLKQNALVALLDTFPLDKKELESSVKDIKEALKISHEETIKYLDDFLKQHNGDQ